MDFDIVIVGGGLSGLALAAELARPEFSMLRVLVLEQRKSYVRDRTWSYWKASQQATHHYSHLERQHWRRWRVRKDRSTNQQAPQRVTKNSNNELYCSLDGDQFYFAAQGAISQSDHVKLRLGISIRRIIEGEWPSVETTDGETICATWIFDARPPQQNSESTLVQQFVGQEIITETDVFDASTVELMHFFPSIDGLHFFYILPYSARNALVETTWISPASFKPDFNAELKQFIASSLGTFAYEVVYEEKGILNLSFDQNKPNKRSRVVALGRAAGTLRASTGYAFLETLEHVEKIASSLNKHLVTDELKNWIPMTFKRRALDAWMDKVFLNVLERDWGTSSHFFMQLFQRLSADTMVAFLSGRASWRQRLLVSRALPSWPFASQALSTLIDSMQKLLRGNR